MIEGGGDMTENNKEKASQTITRNKNKKKDRENKRGVQLSLIGASMEKVEKAPLLCSNMKLFTDEIYEKKVPEEYKGNLFLYMVTKYDCEFNEFKVKY